jgi:hypothetical protein
VGVPVLVFSLPPLLTRPYRNALKRCVALSFKEAGIVEFTGPDGGTVGSRSSKDNGFFVGSLVLLALGQAAGPSS